MAQQVDARHVSLVTRVQSLSPGSERRERTLQNWPLTAICVSMIHPIHSHTTVIKEET